MLRRPARRRVVTVLAVLSLAGAFVVTGGGLVAPTAHAATAAALSSPSPVVTSVGRGNGTLDVFGVDLAGQIYHAAWDPGDMNGWRRTTALSGGRAAPGTSVYAVARTSDQLDAFAVGTDRRVYTAGWHESWGAAWSGWEVLGTLTVAPNTSVHAVRQGPNAMSIFAVGEDGVGNRFAHTNKWTATAGWSGWLKLDGYALLPNTSVFAVSRGVNTMDLFAVNVVNRAVWRPYRNGAWQGWQSLDSDFIREGSGIFPVARDSGSMDIFTVDNNGYVITRPWTSTGGWGWWDGLLDGRAAPGTSVFATVRNSGQIDVFHVGRDRNVYTAGWSSTSGWAGWWNIGATVLAGSSAFAVSRATDILDVFANLDGAGTKTTNWSPSRGWGPWFEVGPHPAGGTSAEVTADIEFASTTADGWARLRIYSTGDYRFQGHFHNGSLTARDIGFAWTIITPSGHALVFTAKQTVGGITHANDYDWDVSGRDPEVQSRWTEAISEGVWYWKARTSLNVSAIVNDIIAAAKFSMATISMIKSVG